MQVLETIQEYAPIKQGIVLVSSLFARYHSPKETSNPVHETKSENSTEDQNRDSNTIKESFELQGQNETNADQPENEAEAETEAETQFLSRELKEDCTSRHNEVLNANPEAQTSHPLSQTHLDYCPCNFTSNSSSKPLRYSGTAVLNENECTCDNNESKTLRNRYLGNGNLKEDSDSVAGSDKDSKVSRRRRFRIFHEHDGFRFTSRSFRPSIFNKRRKRTKKRGHTFIDCAQSSNRCECATGSGDMCLVHAKSHSESDINNRPLCKLNDEYFADASDVSLKSASLADDDCCSDYVDIDLYHVRNSLIDSTSVSASEKSFDLSSCWSEIFSAETYSSTELSFADECRESDIADSASDFSHDSRSHFQHPRLSRRKKNIHLLGHNVNESFMENECCHCILM
eukprot:gene15898-17498_t